MTSVTFLCVDRPCFDMRCSNSPVLLLLGDVYICCGSCFFLVVVQERRLFVVAPRLYLSSPQASLSRFAAIFTTSVGGSTVIG
ncbi:hypothetical protein V6N12_015338 [Hibiscus sabdariffa]|uniref:Uncharacterized protein n=1 Tax=Hibiscus sabdariffa TaxID=183260 RepID=A0ABR2DMU9_9ROSI